MARKNLTPAQIVQIIQMSNGDIKATGLSTKQLIAGLLSSPDLLEQLQAGGAKAATPYAEYDPSYSYSNKDFSNTVQFEYMNKYPQYKTFIKDYWKTINDTSGLEDESVTGEMVQRIPEYAQEYGVSEEGLSTILNEMKDTGEINRFRKAEAARQKKQYAAFDAKKTKLGITSPETAPEEYLKKTTGLAGLGGISGAAKLMVKAKADKYVQGLTSKGYNEAMSYNRGQEFSKKLGRKLTVADLIKKNLMGK